MKKENPTVYSTEWGRICPKCGRPVDTCICKTTPIVSKGDGIVRIQRQSKGRAGKTVTVISGVPLDGEKLHTLYVELKRMCGAGGTVKDGMIEIQGDHRDLVFAEIKKRGFQVKLAGG